MTIIESTQAPVPSKKPWQSKTIWINVLLAASAFIPSVNDWMKANPDLIASGFALLNIILRAVTKDKISLSD